MKVLLFTTSRRQTGFTRHYVGMPPLEPGLPDERERMPPAYILLATVADEGHYLYRLDDRGEPAGDTWHATLADVQEQARLEYEVGPDEWLTIPEEQSDLIAAVRYVRRRLAAI